MADVTDLQVAATELNAKSSQQAAPLPPRNVVITGASAGVGRAVALRFAGEGAKVGLIARDQDALQSLAAEIEGLGASCAVAALDVSDAQAVEDAAKRFEIELGPIDIWVNDAMVTVFSPVHEITPDEFREVTQVTYLGVVHGCMAALRCMRPRGRGHIINIGSALAYRGIPLQAACLDYAPGSDITSVQASTDRLENLLKQRFPPIKSIFIASRIGHAESVGREQRCPSG